MPIRVMMWNIENFTLNKRNNNKWDKAQLRWNHILDTIQRVNPDIFVLIEVESGGSNEGTICGGTAQQGVLQLLADLQAHGANNFNAFRVVPPIVSGTGGKREGIAVFFKTTNLRFTGPYVWTGALASPPRDRQGLVASAAYAAPWNNALPAANNQNQLAGQWRFSDTPTNVNPRQAAANLFPRPDNRSLYRVNFLDTSVVPNRTIELFAMHAPPQPATAVEVVKSLAQVGDLGMDPDNDVVQVLVGDFNVNVIDPDQAKAFDPLSSGWRQASEGKKQKRTPFTRHNINTPTSLKGVGGKSRFLQGKSYKHTGRIAAGQGQPALGPAYYDYIATAREDAGTQLALDNILTRYGGLAAGGPAANFHVVNRVYQMPANGYPPAMGLMPNPANPLVNVAATIPLMLTTYNIGAANPQVAQANSYFRNYTRFGKIAAGRGASDHMALVIDV